GVLPDDHHVDLAGLPDLLVAAVDAVRDARVQLDRPDVGVEVETDSVADHGRESGHLAVAHQYRSAAALGIGPADRAEQDQIGGVALLWGVGRPVEITVLEVILASAGYVLRVPFDPQRLRDRVEDLQSLAHALGSSSVSTERDELVRHWLDVRWWHGAQDPPRG